MVQWLIDNGADVESCGSCEFDQDLLVDVPALWAASAAGHFTIVQILVFQGANVNSRTKTNSTPLRAACFDGHDHIVSYLLKRGADPEIANRYGHTCLMIACYKGHEKCVDLLLDCSELDIDRRSNKGTTALHDAAESNSVSIFEKLLRKGAKFLRNEQHVSPLITAALGGHEKIVSYFATGKFLDNFGDKDYKQIVTKSEIADAVELLGCWSVDKGRDLSKGIQLWSWAIMIRDNPTPQRELDSAFEYMDEIRTINELNEVLADRHRVKMNSLMIRERVLGPKHPEVSFYIRYRGAVYADAGNYTRCLALWKYALNKQIVHSTEPLTTSILSSLHSFVDLFSVMENKNTIPGLSDLLFVWNHIHERFRKLQEFNWTNNKSGVNSADANLTKEQTDEKDQEKEKQFTHLRCILLLILSKMLKILSKSGDCNKRDNIINDLKRLVRINDEKNQLLIHMACQKESDILNEKHCRSAKSLIEKFPNKEVITALIEAGSCVDARTSYGERPLTLAAKAKSLQAVQTLLDHGAHSDFTNDHGQSIADILPESEFKTLNCTLRCLTCYCARYIAKNDQILRQVPLHLKYFVENH
jgi:ankyrin repeat protein